MLGPLNDFDELGVMMLEFLCSLECVMKLLVVVLRRVFPGFPGQFPDASFILSRDFIEPFEAGFNPDHLVVPGS